MGEGLGKNPMPLLEDFDITFRDEAAPVGCDIQNQVGAAPHRFEIDLKEMRNGFDILAGMKEPAGTNRNVHFSGSPYGSIAVATIEMGTIRVAGPGILGMNRGPTRIARETFLVANPAHVWTGVAKHTGVRL